MSTVIQKYSQNVTFNGLGLIFCESVNRIIEIQYNIYNENKHKRVKQCR